MTKEKPLHEAPKDVDKNAEPNTVFAQTTKFSAGQEVKLKDGTIGKVLDEKDGEYAVSHQVVTKFKEKDLSEV
jgi:hypothetical protein